MIAEQVQTHSKPFVAPEILQQPTSENILPILPLKNIAVLPSSIIPIIVGRKSSVLAVEQALKMHNKTIFIKQDDSKATYTKVLTREDGYFDFSLLEIGNLPALSEAEGKLEIARKIRAYYPWPGVYTKLKMKNEKLKIIKFLPNRKVQVEGKKPVDYKDFINGYPKEGEKLIKKLSLI